MSGGYQHKYYLSGLPLGHRKLPSEAVTSLEDEFDLLDDQAEFLKREMDKINARIKELKQGKH